MQPTPTTFEMMLATGWSGDDSIDFLVCTSYSNVFQFELEFFIFVQVGGEAFRPSLLPLVKKCKSVRNVYGPTETTIWSSSYLFDPNHIPSGSAPGTIVVPIGKPISEVNTI